MTTELTEEELDEIERCLLWGGMPIDKRKKLITAARQSIQAKEFHLLDEALARIEALERVASHNTNTALEALAENKRLRDGWKADEAENAIIMQECNALQEKLDRAVGVVEIFARYWELNKPAQGNGRQDDALEVPMWSLRKAASTLSDIKVNG